MSIIELGLALVFWLCMAVMLDQSWVLLIGVWWQAAFSLRLSHYDLEMELRQANHNARQRRLYGSAVGDTV